MTQPTTRSYAAGHFELQIDGSKTTSYLKTCSGGWAKAGAIEDPVGSHSTRIKHLGPVEIEPLSFELGLSGSAALLQWIQGSWNRNWGRRNGQITHADFNLKQTFEHWFYDALILETTFPTLDGASKDPGNLKCKIQPERVRTVATPGSEQSLQSEYSTKQKMWTSSAFRLRIDQFDGMEFTSKIDAFTIKQGIKKMYIGGERLPQIEPTKIDFPNIVGYISLAHAKKLLEWHEQYIWAGKIDPKAQLSGVIEFLSPDRVSTIFQINFFEAGLIAAQIEDAVANVEGVKRVKFEMFVGWMTLDGKGALGLA